MDKNYIVTKSNKLIACNYDLSLQEQKIILTLASMVQPQDAEFKEYEFKIKDFMDLLGIKNKGKYNEVSRITKDLMKKVFEIKEGKDTIQLAWLSSVRYKTGEGIVILKFDSNLKPYMLELQELYTSYKINNILSLKSKYSIRIYEILKSNLFKKSVTIEIEELRNMIGANEKSYNIYNNIKNRILTQSKDELKEKTDICFNIEEIKTGRKITSIKFNIKNNNTAMSEVAVTTSIEDAEDSNVSELSNKIKEIIKTSIAFEITDKTAITFYKNALKNKEYGQAPFDLIKEVAEYSKSQNMKNGFIPWFIGTIKNYIRPSNKSSVAKGSFNDYEQRVYDFDDLERKLLGWEIKEG